MQVIVSIKERKHNLDTTGDPWNGRTLEWATLAAAILQFCSDPYGNKPRSVLGYEKKGG